MKSRPRESRGRIRGKEAAFISDKNTPENWWEIAENVNRKKAYLYLCIPLFNVIFKTILQGLWSEESTLLLVRIVPCRFRAWSPLTPPSVITWPVLQTLITILHRITRCLFFFSPLLTLIEHERASGQEGRVSNSPGYNPRVVETANKLEEDKSDLQSDKWGYGVLHSWVNIDHLVTVLTGMTTLHLNKCISMYKQHLDITICLQGLNFLHSR